MALGLGGNALALVFKIEATGAKATEEEIKHLRTAMNRELGSMKSEASSAFNSIGQSIGLSNSALSALSGVATVAVSGLTILAGAATTTAFAIFEITKEAAHVGEELSHLIEKTGLSAKTITSLKFAAEESGLTLQGLDTGMKLFANTVAKAAQGSEQAGEALKRLGVTPKQALEDLDGTLAKVFKKIYDAPPGIEKMSLAADAFGRRMGANLIPLIESFHGNLGELIKRADELGVTLDEKGVKSLADFERSMNALKAQVSGLERLFATELAPTLTEFFKNLSVFLSENKAQFSAWGTAVAETVRGIEIAFKSTFGQTVISVVVAATKALMPLIAALQYVLQLLRYIGSGDAGVTDPRFKTKGYDPKTGLPDDAKPRDIGDLEANLGKTRGGGGGGGRVKKAKEEKSELDKLWEDQNAKYKQINDAMQAILDQGDKAFEASQKKRADLTLTLSDALDKQREALNALKFGEDSNLESATKAIVKLLEEAQAAGVLTEEMKALAAEYLKTAAATDELIAKTRAYEESLKKLREEEEMERQAIESAAPPTVKKTTGPTSAIDQLFGAIHTNLTGTKQTAALAGLEAITGAFEALAQAVGQAVEAWVLYGKIDIRKVTAQILAGVAAQAAVKAVFELAEGFAALALAFFGLPNAGESASAHFAAAAIYGSIAGIAAVAGRFAASNQFSESATARGSGASTGTGTGASGTTAQPGVTSIGRSVGSPQIINHVLEFKVKGGVVVDEVVRDYQLNGRTRIIFRNDGVVAAR